MLGILLIISYGGGLLRLEGIYGRLFGWFGCYWRHFSCL